ncbi:MAG TPA: pyrroloquinoline quinone-dependent dehydrogenase [Gemmatimonadaceae bacterium]|nr:pyrroloquinoline quinone-dependent dehydrogenase [Gemmatimonadaceae bacterium]
MTQSASRLGTRVLGRLIGPATFGGALALSACVTTPHTTAELATDPGTASRSIDWPSYGYDPAGTRFSPASQITPANAHSLTLAWTYRTGETRPELAAKNRAEFETTPIVIDGVMYLNTPLGRLIALDPTSGSELWVFDAHVDRAVDPGDFASRGVTAWIDATARHDAPCAMRIFLATVDARLIAIDGHTGKVCDDFGDHGTIDLTKGLRNPPLTEWGEYVETSPPVIIDGLVVIGSSIGDNGRVDKPSGEVRAFDARTGARRWGFDPVTQDPSDPHYKSWGGPNGHNTGAANVWSVMAVDSARDLVFLPTTSPSPDYYGGERLGDNRYANSVVALRGSTGKVVWEFQTVHHDLWDYDNASPPALVTITKDGRKQDVVVEATKTGQLFVLDRATGKPVFPVEERPVPRSDVPGEQSWPTQPFNTVIAPLTPQGIDSTEIWGDTPATLAACRAMTRSLRNDGMYTPPSLRGTIQRPSNVGGAAWGGVAFDARTNTIIVPANRIPAMMQLIDSVEYKRDGISSSDSRLGYEYTQMHGTPYVMRRRSLLVGPDSVPCVKPPFGTLIAIDMSTGARRWEVPLGGWPTGGPGREKWGGLALGGPIVTAGGVIFQAGTLDRMVRAYDAANGNELWSARLPAGARMTPMTYVSGRDGRQYMVITAGGGKEFGVGDYVMAFALPAQH